MINIDKFNYEQKEAITSAHPYLKIIAGAGSGKTAVLTNRIAYLIEEYGVAPRNILAITFTNKAAQEMKLRVLKLLDIPRFDGLITTFHGLCLRILREDINLLGYDRNFNILDGDDQKSILKIINKKLNYDKDIFKVNSILNYISNFKNGMPYHGDPELINIYEHFYNEYQKHLKKFNCVDFDDLLLLSVELFKSRPDILDKWRYRFHYIHVDEFQDTNQIQYELVKCLGLDLHVFIVGDPDQTIYTWRGAKIDFILNFEKDFKNAQVIKLEYNYRSNKHILNCANSIIKNNSNRIEKELIATKEVDDKVIHYVANDRNDEADYVVNKIEEIITNNEGVNYDDFAILYRSNYISRVFEQKLIAKNIDYEIIGAIRFYERAEIKDILSYLKVIFYEDDLSFLRIINNPKRSIGSKMIEKIQIIAEQENISYYQVLLNHQSILKLNKVQKQNIDIFIESITNWKKNELNLPDLITDVFNTYNVISSFSEDDYEYQRKVDNINELIAYAHEYDDVIEFLQDISIDVTSNEDDEVKPTVKLLSIHGSKGLEFNYVFAVHLSDGIFPSNRSLESLNIEEERRLAYVCFTRASQQLFILNHRYNHFNERIASSMFIKEIDDELLHKEGEYIQDRFIMPEVNKETIFKKQNVMGSDDFKNGDIVTHHKFNQGIIIDVNKDVLTIAFSKEYGIKTISKNFVSIKK